MTDWHQGAVKLRYTVEGTTGPSLVLLHELGGSMESWDGVVPAFVRDFRVLRYDLRGAGRSETPAAEYTVEDGHLVDLLDLLKATGLKPPYHFVGAAAGAMIAVAFAL
jgi:3-oxoadipate enol-lactonase